MIAQGFNPGLGFETRALKAAPDVGATGDINTPSTDPRIGRHLQGGSYGTRDPGLKPWAKLYYRFAVIEQAPRGSTRCAEFGGFRNLDEFPCLYIVNKAVDRDSAWNQGMISDTANIGYDCRGRIFKS
jgi:hypothetical protein